MIVTSDNTPLRAISTDAKTGSPTRKNPAAVIETCRKPAAHETAHQHEYQYRQDYRPERSHGFPQEDFYLQPGQLPESSEHT